MKHGIEKGLIISSLHEQYKDLHTKCNSISKYFDQNSSNDLKFQYYCYRMAHFQLKSGL
jgi:hypothetical protein